MTVNVTELGHVLGSRTAVHSPNNRAAVLRAALPPDPFEGLFTARIPEPPKLNPSSGADARALIVVRAYLGALKKAGLKPSQWAAYGRRDKCPDITEAKAYPTLCALADLFVEHEIAPAAWAVFRLDVLRHGHAKGRGAQIEAGEPVADAGPFKAPALPELMAKKWLEDKGRRGWFRRDYASRGWAGKVVMTASRKALADLWTDLQRDLDAVPDLTIERARALYEQRFPGDMLATLKRRAEDEARERQNSYDLRAAEGEWLW